MGDPERADEMDEIIARYGEVQGRFEELDGYALDGRAREVLDGLGFSQEMMDGDVGALSGGWKMRVALARILLMRPDAMLLDEPSNHLDLESLIWLEEFLKGYDGALLMTSHDREFMNRIVNKIVEIDGGALTAHSGNYEFYQQQRALNEKQHAGAVRAPAGDAGQGDRLHRTLQGARLACRAGAEPGQEAGEDRPGGAAEAPADGVVRVPAGAALRRGRGDAEGRAQELWQPARSTRGWTSRCGGKRALVRDGHQRRRQVDAAEAGRGRGRAGQRDGGARPERQDGLFRAARDGAARRRAHRVPVAGGPVPAGGPGAASRARRLLRLFRRRDREEMPGACQAARRRGW